MILLDHLRRQFPTAKRQTLKRMVDARRVLINGAAAKKLTEPVALQDQIAIAPAKKSPRPKLPFPIVYEDRDVLVINKPPGWLTSTSAGERRPTVLAEVTRYLKFADPRGRVGLVHRLDREASGLLVFAKTTSSYASLKAQFFHHTVSRVYLAIVSPPPRQIQGRIESRLIERADGSVHSMNRAGKGRMAVTEYAEISRDGEIARLRVTLHTGRKHQIRAHLSESGFPILGDTLYDGRPHKSGLQLTAIHLAFDHPRSGNRVAFDLQV